MDDELTAIGEMVAASSGAADADRRAQRDGVVGGPGPILRGGGDADSLQGDEGAHGHGG